MAAVAYHDQLLDETHASDGAYDACSPVLKTGGGGSGSFIKDIRALARLGLARCHGPLRVLLLDWCVTRIRAPPGTRISLARV